MKPEKRSPMNLRRIVADLIDPGRRRWAMTASTCPTCGGSGVYERPDLSHVRIPHILSPYDDEPCDAEGMEQYTHADCAAGSGTPEAPR